MKPWNDLVSDLKAAEPLVCMCLFGFAIGTVAILAQSDPTIWVKSTDKPMLEPAVVADGSPVGMAPDVPGATATFVWSSKTTTWPQWIYADVSNVDGATDRIYWTPAPTALPSPTATPGTTPEAQGFVFPEPDTGGHTSSITFVVYCPGGGYQEIYEPNPDGTWKWWGKLTTEDGAWYSYTEDGLPPGEHTVWTKPSRYSVRFWVGPAPEASATPTPTPSPTPSPTPTPYLEVKLLGPMGRWWANSHAAPRWIREGYDVRFVLSPTAEDQVYLEVRRMKGPSQ